MTIGATAFLSQLAAALELSLPSIFADQMVLQRKQAVPVWGSTSPGAQVSLLFADQEQQTLADAEGHWKASFQAMAASAESRDILIIASLDGQTTERRITDVLVGEVWLNSGQSNMYRPFRMLTDPAKEPAYEPIAEYLRTEAATANDPLFRQYRVGKITSPFEPNTIGRGQWSKAVPSEVNEFCGTAYFFGRELREKLKVPVALISCNLGGTRIEPWMAPHAFKSDPRLSIEYERHQNALRHLVENWDQEKEMTSYRNTLDTWKRAEAEGGKRGKEPRKPENPLSDKQAYGSLYHGMVHPLIPYAMRGAIWYQGESNQDHFPEQYGLRLSKLIESWRSAWGQETFSFYWCQLANYKQPNAEPVGDEDHWALVQHGQSQALRLPNTGMAVLNDIGEARDIHPKNKIDAGKRLSLWALKQVYQEDLICSGPLFKDAQVKGGKVRIRFNSAGSGLMVAQKHLLDPPVEVDEPLARFQICGSDQKWKWAQAQITDKNSVLVWHPDISQPAEVRYAWSSNPLGANLYNKEGLPTSLFKTGNLQER